MFSLAALQNIPLLNHLGIGKGPRPCPPRGIAAGLRPAIAGVPPELYVAKKVEKRRIVVKEEPPQTRLPFPLVANEAYRPRRRKHQPATSTPVADAARAAALARTGLTVDDPSPLAHAAKLVASPPKRAGPGPVQVHGVFARDNINMKPPAVAEPPPLAELAKAPRFCYPPDSPRYHPPPQQRPIEGPTRPAEPLVARPLQEAPTMTVSEVALMYANNPPPTRPSPEQQAPQSLYSTERPKLWRPDKKQPPVKARVLGDRHRRGNDKYRMVADYFVAAGRRRLAKRAEEAGTLYVNKKLDWEIKDALDNQPPATLEPEALAWFCLSRLQDIQETARQAREAATARGYRAI